MKLNKIGNNHLQNRRININDEICIPCKDLSHIAIICLFLIEMNMHGNWNNMLRAKN